MVKIDFNSPEVREAFAEHNSMLSMDGVKLDKTNPRFIFAVGEFDNQVAVSITPLDYYLSTGYGYDQHLSDILDLGQNFGEVQEAEFEYDGTIKDCVDELIKQGYEFLPDFQMFLEGMGIGTQYINGTDVVNYVKANYPNSIV